MTTNDRLLKFHAEIRPKLKGLALKLVDGCPDAAEDLLSAAASQYPRITGTRKAMWCILDAARAERSAMGGRRRVEADWAIWEGHNDESDDNDLGKRRPWQTSPLADRGLEQYLEYSARREAVDQLFTRLADSQEQAFWAATKAGVERPEAAKQAGLTQVQVTRLIARLRATIRAEDAA